AYGRLPLLSWSGTMFEYLMPLLFTQMHENSLLDRACHDAVRCQIAYAQQSSVPWGISESAFSALDRHNVYQYRAFGVPALALKRGQEDDLVVAPYAAALALGVEPAAAAKNLRKLATLGGSALLSDYGYYEAIDYSRQTQPGGGAGIIIRCYMVHHQGMSLPALAGSGRDALESRFDLRRVGLGLLYPGSGKRNDLEQHPSTGAISRAPLHMEFHAGQSRVPAKEWTVRDHHGNCRLRGRRRGSPPRDFG